MHRKMFFPNYNKEYKKMNGAFNEILFQLENTKFPLNRTRTNVSSTPTEAFVLGQVNYRGQALLNYRTRGPSRYNKKFPKLYRLLRKFMRTYAPNFEYTTIQVNKNIQSSPHFDKNNVGPSIIVALGDFIGGDLVVEGKSHNIKNRLLKFDGTKGHWVTPFKGTRYSLVFFTHTFKPPHYDTRHIKITKRGVYKDGKLIKKY